MDIKTVLQVFTLTIALWVRTAKTQTTEVPICESTGHRCITTDQCASLSLTDGQYQWCGGCQNQVRCLGGVGQLFSYNFHPYTEWDDNRKNYEFTSTTCAECYYPCPPGPSAPTNPSGPLCDRTGFGCLMDSCPGGASGNFQYCGNCSHYVTCSISLGYNLVACASGTFFDDISRTCMDNSTTCRECYTNCSAQTTESPAGSTSARDLGTTLGSSEGVTATATDNWASSVSDTSTEPTGQSSTTSGSVLSTSYSAFFLHIVAILCFLCRLN